MTTSFGERICIVSTMVSALTSSACSVLFTTPPPPNADNLPPMAALECTSSELAPIVDSGVALAMALHMFRVLRAKDDGRTNAVIDNDADLAIAAGAALLFVGSAAYGYPSTYSCKALKRGHRSAPTAPGAFPAQDEDEQRRSRARARVQIQPVPPPPSEPLPTWAPPLSPPKTVGGFAFSISPAEAEKTCGATDRVWEHQGINANCSPKVEGSGAERVRLEFDLDSLTKIVLVHSPDENTFNKSYDTLHGKLKARYGNPRTWRTVPSGACARALPECLKRGETFVGSTWKLPLGRVELVPVWHDQRAIIEERYVREEAAPPGEGHR